VLVLPSRVQSQAGALVVDDVEVNQIVASAMLKRLGYQVDISADGSYALQAVQSTQYDVILMDCLMPVMDGYEATARIRSFEGPARHTYIIAVTAAATAEDRKRCFAVGMDDFIEKPIDQGALRDALARCQQASRWN
jgi:two-component system sensor histidine kinase/response regulator